MIDDSTKPNDMGSAEGANSAEEFRDGSSAVSRWLKTNFPWVWNAYVAHVAAIGEVSAAADAEAQVGPLDHVAGAPDRPGGPGARGNRYEIVRDTANYTIMSKNDS